MRRHAEAREAELYGVSDEGDREGSGRRAAKTQHGSKGSIGPVHHPELIGQEVAEACTDQMNPVGRESTTHRSCAPDGRQDDSILGELGRSAPAARDDCAPSQRPVDGGVAGPQRRVARQSTAQILEPTPHARVRERPNQRQRRESHERRIGGEKGHEDGSNPCARRDRDARGPRSRSDCDEVACLKLRARDRGLRRANVFGDEGCACHFTGGAPRRQKDHHAIGDRGGAQPQSSRNIPPLGWQQASERDHVRQDLNDLQSKDGRKPGTRLQKNAGDSVRSSPVHEVGDQRQTNRREEQPAKPAAQDVHDDCRDAQSASALRLCQTRRKASAYRSTTSSDCAMRGQDCEKRTSEPAKSAFVRG